MRRQVMIVLAGVAALWSIATLAATHAAEAGVARPVGAVTRADAWRSAIEVPGTGRLNRGGQAEAFSVSCASAGFCAAGGSYADNSGHPQAYVASETKGAWSGAIQVPGMGRLNTGGDAEVLSVSCAQAGFCAVGGFYANSSGHLQAFVASERDGAWRTAIELPGTGALDKGRDARVDSISCASAGNCAVGGSYTDRFGRRQAFVASETKGAWSKAIEVPGAGALNRGGDAEVFSVSCASAGNCAAGGWYMDRSGSHQAYVVSERDGAWRTAIQVPGTGALNRDGGAMVSALSCAAAGSCAAGGFYVDRSGNQQVFVVSERGGVWRTAVEMPGSGTLNKGGDAGVNSVSCAAAGNCAAGGFYTDGSFHSQAFVVSERDGAWRAAIEVPGAGALNKGGAAVNSVSCAAAANCAAGGFYTDGSGNQQAFLVSEWDGAWRAAIEVPGTGALNKGGDAEVFSVSCAAVADCAAGGNYKDRSGHHQAFVVNRN